MKIWNYINLFSIGIAVVLSAIILIDLAEKTEDNFENFAMGEGTTPHFANVNGVPVHIGSLIKNDADSLLLGWEQRGRKDVIFLCGNSQMHGINQYEPGMKSYNNILFDEIDDRDVIAQSVQNANLQEFLVMYVYWSRRLPIESVVVPVFFDDMREDNIRGKFFVDIDSSLFFDDNEKLSTTWNMSLQMAMDDAEKGDRSFSALNNTVQERVELSLSSFLDNHSHTWSSRPALRGLIFTSLYKLRNTILWINLQSVRKMRPIVYERNINALKLLIRQTELTNTQVLLYIPPIRSDVKIPYDLDEYSRFKREIIELGVSFGHVTVINLEGIVPGQYWGMKSSTKAGSSQLEYDFMHFQYEGHKILANALIKYIE